MTAAQWSRSALNGRVQMVALMLLPPPTTRPVYSGIARLLTRGSGNGQVVPVPVGAEVGEPQARVFDGRGRVPVAGLDQEDAGGGLLRQRAHERTAGAAGADHDVVVGPLERRGVAGLDRAHAVEFGGERLDGACGDQPGRHGADDEGPPGDVPGDERALELLEPLVSVHVVPSSSAESSRWRVFGCLGVVGRLLTPPGLPDLREVCSRLTRRRVRRGTAGPRARP